jgi:hypothetical protein
MSTTYTSRAALTRLESRLSERDWAIIRFVQQHHFVTTTQLRRCFFPDHASQLAAARACVRVLDRLLTLRILTRLERRVGGVKHGSASFIWLLDVVGERLTRGERRARRRSQEPSPSFLAHALAIVDVHVQLLEAAHAGHFTLNSVQIETDAWRTYIAPHGGTSFIRPDLFVTTSTDQYDDHWYVEVDMGTESLPVVLRKCRAYEDYRRTGRAQTEHGVFPRVLWMLPTTARVARLKAALAADPNLPDRLFSVLTSEELLGTLRGLAPAGVPPDTTSYPLNGDHSTSHGDSTSSGIRASMEEPGAAVSRTRKEAS